jgi:hypothetical protein
MNTRLDSSAPHTSSWHSAWLVKCRPILPSPPSDMPAFMRNAPSKELPDSALLMVESWELARAVELHYQASGLGLPLKDIATVLVVSWVHSQLQGFIHFRTEQKSVWCRHVGAHHCVVCRVTDGMFCLALRPSSCQSLSHSRALRHSVGPERSLPCSQQSSIGPYS